MQQLSDAPRLNLPTLPLTQLTSCPTYLPVTPFLPDSPAPHSRFFCFSPLNLGEHQCAEKTP
jgi:hypothetical protein